MFKNINKKYRDSENEINIESIFANLKKFLSTIIARKEKAKTAYIEFPN